MTVKNQYFHFVDNCGDFNILRIGSKSQVDAKVEKLSLEYLVKIELDKFKRKSSPNTLKSEIHSIMSKMRALDTNCTKLKMSGVDGKAIEVCNLVIKLKYPLRFVILLLNCNRFLDPVHTRADPYGSDPKLVRIGLPCTLVPTYRSQFVSAIRINEVRIKRTELCGSDPFGSRVNPRIESKKGADRE